jgi:septal ring factor EnvC (AmiA/AmiB activator)
MERDKIDDLFEVWQQHKDVLKPTDGHRNRFEDRLLQAKKPKKTNRFWWMAAASVALIVALLSGVQIKPEKADLANVSPEMKATENFFKQTIQTELERLQENNLNESTKQLATDALKQLDALESDYENLRAELVKSGYNQQVIYAMIDNFQKRIALLQNVIKEIESLQKLNENNHEVI